MASCVLRKTLLSGLQRAITARKTTHLRVCNGRSIYSSIKLLKKYYTVEHEWLDVPDGQETGTVGITDYAQDKLGDVVFIELPSVSQVLEAGGEAGVLESVKAASDILSPVSGEVTEVNDTITETPESINKDPYGAGWLYKVKLSDLTELETLMDEEGYNAFLAEQE